MTLKGLREQANLTQTQVAKLTDITARHIYNIENGKRKPSDNLKLKLAKLYHVKPEDIFLICQRTKSSEND